VQVPVLLIEDRIKKTHRRHQTFEAERVCLGKWYGSTGTSSYFTRYFVFFRLQSLEEYTLSTIVPDAKFIVCRIRAIGREIGDIKTTGSLTSDEDFPE
jgi:hypothetical protein